MNDPRSEDLADIDAERAPSGPRRRLFAVFGLVVLAVGLGGGWWWHESARAVSTDNAYVAADVANVMSQTEGTVIAVHAAETGAVRRGDVLVELDPADARIALAQAEAEYARVRRRVQQYYEEDKAAAAQVRRKVSFPSRLPATASTSHSLRANPRRADGAPRTGLLCRRHRPHSWGGTRVPPSRAAGMR